MTYFVVMRLQLWDDMEIDPKSVFRGFPMEIKGMGIGCLPVFPSQEEARAQFPDPQIVIQEVVTP